MINMLNRVFDKLGLYKLTEEKDKIEEEFNELEFSLGKAKENVKKSKLSGNDELIIECDSLLSSITLEYEKVKEKKYTLRLMEVYDVVILDIGPSTENGIPNYGLCEFKESIGCSVTMKYSFEL